MPDAEERAAEWYRRTGIYPMHGTVVVKEPLLRDHPWLADALSEAFEASKQDWLARWRSGEADSAQDRSYRALSRVVGDDPLPYGLEPNRPSIDALQRICVKQGLLPGAMPVERLFHPVSPDLFRSTP